MKKITCTIAALLIGVFAMNAQQKADVKAATTAKKVVTKEVRQAKDVKATKVLVEKTADEKVIRREDQKGDAQMKKKKAKLIHADQKANKIKKKVDN